MKTALITGMAGFVGSHLAEYLYMGTDWEIVGLVRWQDSLDNLHSVSEAINNKSRVSLRYGDLNDGGSLRKVVKTVKPDYVFHLAAQSYPQTSFTSPEETINTNTLGTLRLLDVLREFCPRAWVHVCSSSEVYGRVPREFVPIKENCPFHPASPYAISKAGADLLAQHYHEAYGLKIQITRMFTHTGPGRGDVFAESSFAKQIAMIENNKIWPVLKVGNLKSLRTVADVRDAVKAYYMLLTVNPVRGAIYNIGGDYTCTVQEILDNLLGRTRAKIRIEVDPIRLRPLDADLQVPDSSKFRSHTGWIPSIPFDQTMGDLLEYWRKRVADGAVTVQR